MPGMEKKRSSGADRRIAALEEEADKWRSTIRRSDEEGKARYYCPRCLAQSSVKLLRCSYCGGVLVPVGTPPAVARRMMDEGVPDEDAAPHGPEPAGTAVDAAEEDPESIDRPRGAHRAPPHDEGGEDVALSIEGREERPQRDRGRGAIAHGRRKDARTAQEGQKGRLRRIRFCRNCGSDDLERPAERKIRCRSCGSLFLVRKGE